MKVAGFFRVSQIRRNMVANENGTFLQEDPRLETIRNEIYASFMVRNNVVRGSII